MSPLPHISVCTCTFRRPEFLARLIRELLRQETAGRFTFSIVVADNDAARSAEPVIASLQKDTAIEIRYAVEPRQNIALARNKAIENARGDYVAFIDDDELPGLAWLFTLYQACEKYGADGVLGPVHPSFAAGTPSWVVKGGFYDRRVFPTGTELQWRNGRTGNLLLKREVFTAATPQPFRPEFRAAEDQDFFRRQIEQGYRFVWCDEAVAYESVPPGRWKRSVLLKRALLRGTCAARHPMLGFYGVAKSVIAVPLYAAALPLALVFGHHRFMMLLVRLCDHLGKLLALMGIDVIREPYVTG